MLPGRLDELSAIALQQLCTDRCSESKTLDFKASLPSTSDKDKAEFLKDVTALANSDGGDLVFGVAEKEGVANRIVPITSESADAAKRRLGQLLDSGTEPRIHGIQIHSVSVENGCVLIVRVPASFDGPHRYLFNGHSKFVMRNGTHITELSYEQLRTAFDRTATLVDRTRSFMNNRAEAIVARRTPRPMQPGPMCLVHLVPLASMGGRLAPDISALEHDFTKFIFSDWGGGSRALNLDGLLVYTADQRGGVINAYVQAFRSGAFEAGRFGGSLSYLTEDGEPPKRIPSTTVTTFYREAVVRFIATANALGYSGPAVLRFALLSIQGYEFAVGEQYWGRGKAFADRPDLVLPDAWIEDLAAPFDVDTLVRPMMDILWQAFDVARCLEYDESGAWCPRR
ncbi:MAG: ATP-binding protein [Sulfuritalea sp.]|jgi:hypothetical protein|nr:ATP-binding protein [Sulfuritalea sp.]